MANDIVTANGGQIVESSVDISSIGGDEKAAILLLSLNESDAASIIRHLEPKQVQRVGSAMAKATDLSKIKSASYTAHFWKTFRSTPTSVWAAKTSCVMR